MKCEHCGSPLAIEQERCPFCDQPNPHFQQHREDMKRFSADYQRTKQHVYQQTQKWTGLAVPLTVLACLLLLNIVVYGALANSWEFTSWLSRRRILQQEELHQSRLEQYLSEQDYLSFHRYYNQNQLYLADEFDCYRSLDNAASSFESVYRWLLYYRCEDYYSREEVSDYVADSLGYLYESKENFGAYEFQPDDPAYLPLIDDMIEKAHLLTSSILDLPLDLVETFPDLSAAKRRDCMEGAAEYV